MFLKHYFIERSIVNLWVKSEFHTVWSRNTLFPNHFPYIILESHKPVRQEVQKFILITRNIIVTMPW